MSEWKLFSEVWPGTNEKFWYSDGKFRFLGYGKQGEERVIPYNIMNHFLVDTNIYRYWISLDLPELPKPVLHSCVTPSGLICTETKNGLMVSCWSMDRKECVHHLVKACPNCGYNPDPLQLKS